MLQKIQQEMDEQQYGKESKVEEITQQERKNKIDKKESPTLVVLAYILDKLFGRPGHVRVVFIFSPINETHKEKTTQPSLLFSYLQLPQPLQLP